MSDIESYDLIVYDEDCEDMGQDYRDRASVFEGIMDQYTGIIQNVLNIGVKEGKVHDNLENYLTEVSKLKNQTSQLADDAADCLQSFRNDMDTADSYIY